MKITYRPEIDGLRAIAVVAVILYHAKINIFNHQPFKGGFIGVDIFFVISGYLITSIILKELATTGSFSFKHFYERRIRRILPALLFVMLASLPFAWMYLLPVSLIDFSKSILYSLGFSSNFYFWYSGEQYGAAISLLRPFLHTWSLSVEEQYYILFPIVLLITFKYFRKYLIHILILGFVISLGLADWGSRNFPSFNFYVLPTRGWELLAGSILGYFEIIKGHRSQNKVLNLILPFTGLILIGHSILFFNDKMFHPSFYTLSPIIGACLIIWFSNKNELITKILSTKLFVGIGLISYSLYLWHYPVFAFTRVTEKIFTQEILFNNLLLGIIIVILSVISYYFIEGPARNQNNKFKVVISLVIISIFFLITYSFNLIKKDRYESGINKIFIDTDNLTLTNVIRDMFLNDCRSENCFFNIFSSKKIFLVGDSHAFSLLSNLKDKVVHKNYNFITSIKSGCSYYPYFNRINPVSDCNDEYFQDLKNKLLKEENSIIIFNSRFYEHIRSNVFIPTKNSKYKTISDSFKSEILEISKNNKIIIIYPFPEMPFHVPQRLLNLTLKNKNSDIENFLKKSYLLTSISYEKFISENKAVFDLFDSIENKNIIRVYPHTLFCDTIIKNRCASHDDKNIFYNDSHHPSTKGAEMINYLIIKEIEKIELKSN
jgi:peptidoglycan/LPS O-acetylase OafA/YrhL